MRRRIRFRDDCQTLCTPDDTVKAGTWSVTVQDDYIIMKPQYACRQSLVLTDDKCVFLASHGTSFAASKSGKAREILTAEALKVLAAIKVERQKEGWKSDVSARNVGLQHIATHCNILQFTATYFPGCN